MKIIFILFLSTSLISMGAPASAKRIKKKAAHLKQRIIEIKSIGGDATYLLKAGKKVKELASSGRLEEAEKVLDNALAFKKISKEDLPDPNRVGKYFRYPRAVKIHGYPENMQLMEPYISRDGKLLFWNNLNNLEITNTNIYYAEKIDIFNFQFKGEVKGINTDKLEGVPSMDKFGNFYFVSPRNLFFSKRIAYRGKFKDGKVTNVELVPGIKPIKRGWVNMDNEISFDGNLNIYTQTWFGGRKGMPRKSYFEQAFKDKNGDFVRDPKSDEIYKEVNSSDIQYANTLSSDGLELIFTRAIIKEGSYPKFQILRSTRANKTSSFSKPEVLTVFTGLFEAPTLTSDDKRMYYHQKINGKWKIFTVERNP